MRTSLSTVYAVLLLGPSHWRLLDVVEELNSAMSVRLPAWNRKSSRVRTR